MKKMIYLIGNIYIKCRPVEMETQYELEVIKLSRYLVRCGHSMWYKVSSSMKIYDQAFESDKIFFSAYIHENKMPNNVLKGRFHHLKPGVLFWDV